MPDSQEKVGLIVEATDKASAVIKQIGATATSAFNGVSDGVKKAGAHIASLPDKLGKSATALLLFQNATSQMGGKVADAANKLAALGGIIATGGPVGIAIAGLTLGLAAASYAWEAFTQETRDAETAQKAITDVFARNNEKLTSARERTKALGDEVKFFGLTTREAAVASLKEQIATQQKAIESAQAHADALIWNGRAFRELAGAQKEDWEVTQKTIEQSKALISEREAQLGELRELLRLEKQKSDTDKRQQATEAASMARRNEILATLKQEIEAWGPLNKEQARYGQTISGNGGQLAMLAAKLEHVDRLSKAQAENLKQEIDLSKLVRDEETATINKIIERREFAHNQMLMQMKRERTLREKDLAWQETQARETDAKLTSMEKQRGEMSVQIAGSTMQAYGAAFTSIIEGSEGAGRAMLKATVQAAYGAIMAYAATSAAGAASSQSAIPVVGPFLAPIAATVIFGLVMALINKLPSFATGGSITGGIPGIDSVPILTQAKERVLSVRQNDLFERLVTTLEGRSSGGGSLALAGAGVGTFGGGGSINLTIRSDVPPTNMDYLKASRKIARATKDLARRRMT